jgi:hypothetical protein
LRNGQVYITGTSADIESARSGSALVVGRQYWETDGGTRVGRAIAVNQIRWEVSMTDVNSAVLVETNRAIAAEGVLQAAISQEVTDRQAALAAELAARVATDTQLASAINTEVAARELGDTTEMNARIAADAVLQGLINQEVTDRATDVDAEETARIAAISALQTQVATDMAALASALRDERVTDFKGVDYTQGQSIGLAAAVGANPLEGIHVLKFNSTDINNTATLTGLPGGAADMSISYNDMVRVVVDGGVIVSATLIDDALKVKFNALDASIADLQAATTQTAIRSHFSATGFAKYVNGVISVVNSVATGNDITSDVNGNIFLDVDATTSVAGGSTQSINAHLVDLYDMISAGAFSASSGVEKVGSEIMLGTNLTRNTVIGGAFKMDYTNTLGLGAEFMRFPVFQVTNGSRGTKVTGSVEFWFDQDGDPKYTFIPN